MKIHALPDAPSRVILVGCLSVVLAGCWDVSFSSSDDSDSICDALGGGAATVASTPQPGSSFDNAPAAFDGDLGTTATLTALGTGGGTIRGTAQPGVVAAGGRVAGILYTNPANGLYAVTINTYQGGVLADSGSAGSQSYQNGNPSTQNCAGTCLVRNGVTYMGIGTSEPFDAIEAVLTVNAATEALAIRELCIR